VDVFSGYVWKEFFFQNCYTLEVEQKIVTSRIDEMTLMMHWKQAFQYVWYRISLTVVIVLLLVFLFEVPYYFQHVVEVRPGTQLTDILLNLSSPVDHSTAIFILLYGTIIISSITLIQKPLPLLIVLTAYCIENYLRCLTLWLFPLEPPAGIIPLIDPLINSIAYGEVIILKDLFFSGHVATLTILAAVEETFRLKIIKWSITIAVGLLLMHQRVHYTMDVVAGMVISVLIVKGTIKLVNYLRLKSSPESAME
jgi:hypothetical protein